MSQEKKYRIIVGSICAGLILLLILFVNFVAVSTEGAFTEGGGCFSVAFDKAVVMGADRIVIREGNEVVTITDAELVREIAAEFVVANRTDLCGYQADKWMEIYNGDRLVRSIRWNECCELVEIYEADVAHWVWPSGSGIGQVELSREFMARLDEIIESADG